ncbi:hypothetical protein MSG28_000307 [Choristoneura fumiferana]|uniref:Uncharacterized protein n=1 Tax=Choristoneura fumiferana TaxID=7141 RepID=A0ACC0K000_CHOFU|nr:hypothetical protein MSG28_000307 [Choristoneura fumiferana]
MCGLARKCRRRAEARSMQRAGSGRPAESARSFCEGDSCGEAGSGHRGSLRGANKLARRARSFKDDLLERISNMRSPAQQHHPPHLSSAIRSHSPLSPKIRNMAAKTSTSEEGEVTPAKELERLVKEVTFGLKHFSDVIKKKKLEMLPDNGTIVFESIANIHKAIKPYSGRSPSLMSAVKRLCNALAKLIQLCDEIAAVSLRADAGNVELDTSAAALSEEHVNSVVKGVTSAVEEVAALAQQHMTRPALSPRPALVSPRASTQRNSLPDIPLTPKERSLLTGDTSSESSGVRASHSSESVLDAPDSPPPKPARPNRLSLQSHSSGSLDSMLNVSNDEDRHAHDSSSRDRVFVTPPTSDLVGICSCSSAGEMRASLESQESHVNSIHVNAHSNHNRNFDNTVYMNEMMGTRQSFESFMNVINMTNVTTHQSVSTTLPSITSDESETPPELPVKTRRSARADVQHSFPTVEIRQSPVCSLHGEARPHTLADHHPPRPPPLPLKKKHIMAYMEMFGNCSHPPNNAAAPPDMFRHSIHTYNLASAQHTSGSAMVTRHQQIQRSIGQSFTVQHFGSPPVLSQFLVGIKTSSAYCHSGSEDSVSLVASSGTSPVPPEPPALPPKMNKTKTYVNSTNELLPPPSPRPSSHNSSTSVEDTTHNNVNSDESYVSTATPVKFPLEDELEMLVPEPAPSPVPSQRSESSTEPATAATETNATPADADPEDIILQTDISSSLLLKAPSKDGPEVRGGHPDALIVLATKATKDFAYQEAFLATYRTWVAPADLVARLMRRAHHFKPRPHELRSTLSLLTRVVNDLTMTDLEESLMQKIMEFIYWLIEVEELPIAKALRQILVDKQKQLHFQQTSNRYEYETPTYVSVSIRRDTLLDFKPSELAEQMTLLDAALFVRITTAEVLSWPRDQSEESSPNLTRFTEHFNKMSYWARSRILEQDEAQKRERYVRCFLKVMKALRKINNFNSYLALVSALDSPPVRRLGWPRAIVDQLHDHCAIIDSSSINFTKRWQQYHIMENMKRFHKDRQYKFKKSERIQAMFNEFDDVLSEEALWQISESLKPRARSAATSTAPAPAPAAAPTPAPATA